MQIKNNSPFIGVHKKNELPGDENKNGLVRNFLNRLEYSENRENLGVDKIRSQVMNLHGEVKDLQTKISAMQIQISFLETLPNDSNWKEELQTFMNEKFRSDIVIKAEPDIETYVKKLGGEIKVLNNDMLTREIKLENILSSGLIDTEKSDISNIIVKDIQKANDVFSKLKTENIFRVLKT